MLSGGIRSGGTALTTEIEISDWFLGWQGEGIPCAMAHCVRISSWCISQPGFNPSFKQLTCLATLKSCDTTKQSACGWLYIYI